jgi:hypothetical protein
MTLIFHTPIYGGLSMQLEIISYRNNSCLRSSYLDYMTKTLKNKLNKSNIEIQQYV